MDLAVKGERYLPDSISPINPSIHDRFLCKHLDVVNAGRARVVRYVGNRLSRHMSYTWTMRFRLELS